MPRTGDVQNPDTSRLLNNGLYTIDTSLLEGVYVFRVGRLLEALGARIPEAAAQHEFRSVHLLA